MTEYWSRVQFSQVLSLSADVMFVMCREESKGQIACFPKLSELNLSNADLQIPPQLGNTSNVVTGNVRLVYLRTGDPPSLETYAGELKASFARLSTILKQAKKVLMPLPLEYRFPKAKQINEVFFEALLPYITSTTCVFYSTLDQMPKFSAQFQEVADRIRSQEMMHHHPEHEGVSGRRSHSGGPDELPPDQSRQQASGEELLSVPMQKPLLKQRSAEGATGTTPIRKDPSEPAAILFEGLSPEERKQRMQRPVPTQPKRNQVDVAQARRSMQVGNRQFMGPMAYMEIDRHPMRGMMMGSPLNERAKAMFSQQDFGDIPQMRNMEEMMFGSRMAQYEHDESFGFPDYPGRLQTSHSMDVEDCKCEICKAIYDDNKLCEKCGAVVCKFCLRKSSLCPNCGEMKNFRTDKTAALLIASSEKRRCRCGAEVSKETLPQHELECQVDDLRCEKCKQTFQLSTYKEHLKEKHWLDFLSALERYRGKELQGA